jgi:hypothetical protein
MQYPEKKIFYKREDRNTTKGMHWNLFRGGEVGALTKKAKKAVETPC